MSKEGRVMTEFKIIRDGKEIALTADELEAAYDDRQRDYLEQDIIYLLDEEYKCDSPSEDQIDSIIDMFILKSDSNLSHKDNLRNAIERVLLW